MVINNQYYDWGFQNRFSIMDMIYSTMEGIVPSCCRLTTRHLGATLFKLILHRMCKSHVTASMYHGTWGLMQSHFCSTYWRPDSSHGNEPALGGYQLLLSKIQCTQASSHYIERSTIQLVENKALNLVDMGSSPMVEIILYDVIIKVPTQYYLTKPALGGYTLLFKFTWLYL